MGQALKKYTPEQVGIADEIILDHSQFCAEVLKVGSKSGKVVPLIHNRTQRELLKLRDKQLRETGRVRIVIVKARRHGVSTEVAAIGYNNALIADLAGEKYGTFILAHREDTAISLFDIVKLFHSRSDDFAPKLKSCSKTDMVFDRSGSTYKTGTASSPDVGRGMTVHFLHCSEIAYMTKVEDIAGGLFEAVGDEPGTEIYLESTAKGEGGYFHNLYLRAKQGTNDFAPFFAPWYWDDGCQRDIPQGFTLTEEEVEYKELYNLTDRQMAWKQAKEGVQGRTEKEGKLKFKQEYPANDIEAFQYSAVDSHITADSVLRAFKRPQYRSFGAIRAAFDPSFTKDGDRKAFCYGQGPNIWGLEYPKLDDHDAQVAYLKRKLDNKVIPIDRLFIDAGGGGYAIYQCLCNDGYGDRVEIVNSARSAEEDVKYANARAEMTDRVKLALEDNDMPLSISVDPSLESELLTDLTAEGSTEDRNNRILIEKKEDVKKRLGISPDGKDAIGLLFAKSVIRQHVTSNSRAQHFATDETSVFNH